MIKQYKPPIVLCGGLFSNLEFKDNVIIKLKKTYPSNEIIIPKFPPVIGAYVLSLIENNQNKFTRTIQQVLKIVGTTLINYIKKSAPKL